MSDLRRQETLLQAGALQKAILESANFSSIATDAEGVIQVFNVGAQQMLGYTSAEVLNTITPADISDPDELVARAEAMSLELGTPIAPGFEALVYKASRGIEDIYELTYIRKDETRLPAVVSVTALRDDRGAIIGYLLIGTDNTARKQVEAARRELDQRLRDQQYYTRSLVESHIDALMAIDPSGVVTDVNEQMVVLTGCPREELIGSLFRDSFTDPERAESAIATVLFEERVTDYELTVRARDGRETVVSCNAATYYDQGHTLKGVFVAARDITERKRLDEALRDKNTELEAARLVADKANLAKSEFLSSMSHELRSPLNAILGFAQLLDTEKPPPTPNQKKSIGQILRAGWYLLQLINEILDLAVIESGKVSLSVEPVSLADALLECRAMVQQQADERGTHLHFPLFDAPVFVLADRVRLKQVVINLLSNAIKYSDAKSTIVVEVTALPPHRARIGVRDQGAGLSQDQVAQLFQPFNRLGREKTNEQGTGIGLVVSKLLVELMGGEIGAHSTLGVGSRFWFEIGACGAPGVQDESGGGAPVLTRPAVDPGSALRTLLYIEDNAANLALVEELIGRRSDLRLLSATNGIDGVVLAKTQQPDVILMDLHLPGITGTQALALLLHDPTTAHIPVLAISANAMKNDIARSLDAGFFRYLTKPIDVDGFMRAVDEALEHAAAQSAADGEIA